MLPVQFEIEITSKCNARCPGCSRTLDGDTHPDLQMLEITLPEFKHIFPPEYIRERHFGFSGVYGDPGMARDILSICEYLLEHDAHQVYLDTNGGMQTESFWYSMGKISEFYDQRLCTVFNVDGFVDTNHLYRVNVNWQKLLANMTSYAQTKGRALWQYIEFDHNSHDIDNARQLASSLNFEFRLRKSARNYVPWTTTVKQKATTKTYQVSTSNLHTEAQKKHNIYNTVGNLKTVKFDDINCRLIHQRQAYVSHDQKLWPCCWFGDMYHDNIREAEGRAKLLQLEALYGTEWNCLKHNSIDKILDHEYYKEVLADSWNTEHNLYISRCVVECGGHGSRRKIQIN